MIHFYLKVRHVAILMYMNKLGHETKPLWTSFHCFSSFVPRVNTTTSSINP